MPRKIGYARVSTGDQHLHLQHDALDAAGCAVIYSDKDVSGAARERPELTKALADLSDGDTLVVWKLDRLARSLFHLIDVLEGLAHKGVQFKSLTEKIDTTSAYGEFTFHMIGALAQMERRLISERTKAGLQAAKRRGTVLGRKPVLSPEQSWEAYMQKLSGKASAPALAHHYGVSVMTIYRACQRMEQTEPLSPEPCVQDTAS